jgi:hypothetical protein
VASRDQHRVVRRADAGLSQQHQVHGVQRRAHDRERPGVRFLVDLGAQGVVRGQADRRVAGGSTFDAFHERGSRLVVLA